jgi:peptidoglycan-associated lipoprotein
MKNRLLSPTPWLMGSLLLGCSSTSTRMPEVAPRIDAAPPSAVAAPPTATQSVVQIDPRLQEMCNLPTPTFAFDDAAVVGPAESALGDLAHCLVAGPGKSVKLALVGHADPRGEHEYNLGLGHKRSGAIASFLTKRGVPSERLTPTSRGEFEARGQDEEGWARDRRVDVSILD